MSRPASPIRAVAGLAGLELRLSLRRGENLVVTGIIPPAVLVFFAGTGLPGVPGRPTDILLPGTIAIAVMATSLVSLGIVTAYERHYGVLKRLGGAPIPRWALLAAKLGTVVVIEALQVGLLVVVAVVVLGWRPGPGWSPAIALVAVGLGTAAFAGLGLLMAGRLRAEAVLALANGLFIGLLLLGGVILPADHLPAPLGAVAGVLPAGLLTEALRVALGAPGDAAPQLVGLAAWAIGLGGFAARGFRWD